MIKSFLRDCRLTSQIFDTVILFQKKNLTRIFHTNLLRKPGSQMDAALESHFDLDGRDSYSPASIVSLSLGEAHHPSLMALSF